MDESSLKKLAAAREHERAVAEVAVDVVRRLEGKVERIRRDLEATLDAVESARAEVTAAANRAEEAAHVYMVAAGENGIVVQAQVATGEAD